MQEPEYAIPEDDPSYIPIMPENYGAEFRDFSAHKNIEGMTDEEVAAFDIRDSP